MLVNNLYFTLSATVSSGFCLTVDVNCGHPGILANGNIILTNTTLGSTIAYACDVSFVLCGNDTRICQSNGMWSGSLPSCNLISEYSQC